MPAIKHIHTYVKYKGKPKWYRCAAPNCTHHIDKEVLPGKLSLCTSCGSEMILTFEHLRRVNPKCMNCSGTKKAKLFQKAQELTKYLGTEHFDPLDLMRLKTDQGELVFSSAPDPPGVFNDSDYDLEDLDSLEEDLEEEAEQDE